MTDTGRLADVTIVGGGIIGCALAYELARQGASVEVLERREIGREASWASAGIISPPGPRHGTRSELALLAFRRYPALIAEVEHLTGVSVGYATSGEIDLGTADSAPELRTVLEWRETNGLVAEWLDEAELRSREPAVAGQFTCAIASPQAGSVVLGRMTSALALAARYFGAQIVEHESVLGVTLSGGRATALRTFGGSRPVGTLVVAAGAWSRTLGEMLDFSIPTLPVRGQMLAIADPPLPIRSVIAGGGGYLVPRADGTIAVGATEEYAAGFDNRVTPNGLLELVELVTRVAPSLADGRFVASWAGLRPGSEDGELIVGRVSHLDNVWVATGHFRSGALLAPSTAELLAPSILGGPIDERLRPFDPGRFA